MTRYMLMRQGESDPKLIPESPLLLEKNLHDVLTYHPQLLPAEDMGLEDPVVVGRESSLTSGYADLVLVDARGQICLVEVKKEGNPDTRQVVAQLLDYAAGLWGQSLVGFEQILAPYLGTLGQGSAPLSLVEYLAAQWADDDESGEALATTAVERAAQTLETGDFTLVVAAPEIPTRVQSVLEYMNARGQRFFGLEVSHFEGPAECFVPRLVVMPPISKAPETSSGPVMTADDYLSAVPAHIRDQVAQFLGDIVAAGGEIVWWSYGASINVTLHATRQVGYLSPTRIGATIQASSGFPQEPFDRTAQRLADMAIGQPGGKGWYHSVKWTDVTEEQAAAVCAVVIDCIRDLVPARNWEAIDGGLELQFERNDHNVWEKHVPALADYRGRRLRGAIRRSGMADDVAVELIPLGGGAPGWRPMFPAGGAEAVWPVGVCEGDYALRLEQVAA